MPKIVTPMDLAMASLKMWRIGAQHTALATMDLTERANEILTPGRSAARDTAEDRHGPQGR